MQRYQLPTDLEPRHVRSVSRQNSGEARAVTSQRATLHLEEPDYDEIEDWDEVGEWKIFQRYFKRSFSW